MTDNTYNTQALDDLTLGELFQLADEIGSKYQTSDNTDELEFSDDDTFVASDLSYSQLLNLALLDEKLPEF